MKGGNIVVIRCALLNRAGHGEDASDAFPVQKPLEGLVAQIAHRVARHALESRIDVQKPAGQIQPADDVRVVLKQRLVALLAHLQPLLGPLALRNVVRDDQGPDRLPAGSVQQLAVGDEDGDSFSGRLYPNLLIVDIFLVQHANRRQLRKRCGSAAVGMVKRIGAVRSFMQVYGLGHAKAFGCLVEKKDASIQPVDSHACLHMLQNGLQQGFVQGGG